MTESSQNLWLLAGLAAVGAWVLFKVLAFLQRRLRIFTRGTVTFMVLALMVTTMVGLIELAQDVRDSERRARTKAERQVALDLLSAWLAGDRQGLERQLSDNPVRCEIEAGLAKGDDLVEQRFPPASIDDPATRPELLALSLDNAERLPLWPSEMKRRGFTAVLRSAGELVWMTGWLATVATVHDDRSPGRVVEVHVKKLVDVSSTSWRRWRSLSWDFEHAELVAATRGLESMRRR